MGIMGIIAATDVGIVIPPTLHGTAFTRKGKPCSSCCFSTRWLFSISSQSPSTSAAHTSSWEVETWEPTWFCFDGEPLSCARAPTFSGSDAPAILAELGYSQGQVLGLKQSRAVVPTNWHKWCDEDHETAQPLKLFYSDELHAEGLE